jgi:hypothetical protein
MFEEKVDSLDQLDECEFSALVDALYSENWDEFTEMYEEEPPDWIVEWAQHLEAENLYSLSDLDPIWTHLNLLHDRRANCSYLYTEGNDYSFISKKIPSSGNKLTKKELWPLVKSDLEDLADSILYGAFEISSAWISEAEIGGYLRELMQANGVTHLKGGKGPTLEGWLAEQYSK